MERCFVSEFNGVVGVRKTESMYLRVYDVAGKVDIRAGGNYDKHE